MSFSLSLFVVLRSMLLPGLSGRCQMFVMMQKRMLTGNSTHLVMRLFDEIVGIVFPEVVVR